MSWFSKAWNWLSDTVSNAWNDWTGNTQIDKQLEAQDIENQETRDYNYMLWQQENSYNAPSAQKARLQSAGLNADMMYGGSGVSNTASSPSPAQPMDWTSLGAKKSIGQVAMELAQTRLVNAQADKVSAETKGQNIANEFAVPEKILGLELTKSVIDKNRKELEVFDAKIPEIQALTANLDADTALKAIQRVFEDRTMESRVKKVAAELDLSEADAKVAMETIISRIALQSAAAEEAQNKADLVKIQQDAAKVNVVLQCLDRGLAVLDVILSFKNGKVPKTIINNIPAPAGN